MPAKRYIVSLTAEERQTLEQLTKTGKAAAAKINHARILLKADVNHPNGGWTEQAISDAFNISTRTIERVRQRFVEESLDNALTPRPRQSLKLRRLDGEAEAHLVAIAQRALRRAQSPAAERQRDIAVGHCGCWLTKW